MNYVISLRVLLLILILYYGENQICAQNLTTDLQFQISPPSVNKFDGEIWIEIVAKRKGQAAELTTDNLIFKDSKNGIVRDLEIKRFDRIEPTEREQLTILFLIDISGSMKTENKFENAKKAILRTTKNIDFPPRTTLLLSTFHDYVSENISFNEENVDSIISEILTTGNDTDLHTAIISKANSLAQMPGKKAIILLSDGEHDVRRNPKYQKGLKAPTESDVFKTLSILDNTILVFPVGLGKDADEDFLRRMSDTTSNPMDLYSFTNTPQKLDSIFFRLASGLSGNYRLLLGNNFTPYIGEERQLSAAWVEKNTFGKTILIAEDKQIYREGKVNYPIPARTLKSYWYKLAAIGLAIIFLIFSLLSLLMPVLRRKRFYHRYVHKYERKGNVIAYDTVTNEPIADGTLVVRKCKQIIPLDVWEGVGEKCPHFPECLHSLGCDGSGGKEVNADFFSQKGDLKKLNWLWFGAIGGFFSWIIYALYRGEFFIFRLFHRFIERILNSLDLASYSTNQVCQNCSDISNETFVGLSVGVGITLGLLLPEQLNHTHGISPIQLLLKTILGLLAGALSFFIGGILHPNFISNVFFSGLISWIFLGFFLSIILSYASTISLKRAIIASLIASLASYLIYYLAFIQGWQNTEPIRLLSLIVLGGIMGLIVVTVITNLEDFEIEFLSPDQFRGYKVPISKWLQQGLTVTIGIAPKNQIFIKWQDEAVADVHASFSLHDNKVYIHPLNEVLLNGRLVTSSQVGLKDEDLIQLGRHSRTKFYYRERRMKEDNVSMPDLPVSTSGKGSQ